MPKTKLQNVIFTIIMAFVMVYAMVCYNIAIDKGGMSNQIFLLAFHEMPIMWPIAAILEFFVVEKLSKFLAFRIVSNIHYTCNLFYDCLPDVSGHELYRNCIIQTSRKRDYSTVVTDNSN